MRQKRSLNRVKPLCHILPTEVFHVIDEVRTQRNDKSSRQQWLTRIWALSLAALAAGIVVAAMFRYFDFRNLARITFVVSLIIFTALLAGWVALSIFFGIRGEGFRALLVKRVAFDEDAIAKFRSFPVDVLKTVRIHLEREHARMTARRTTCLYLMASPAVLVTIIGWAQLSPQNPILLLLTDVAGRVESSGGVFLWFGLFSAALLLGFLIGGFANHVHCETLGRLIFVVGEAERRKARR